MWGFSVWYLQEMLKVGMFSKSKISFLLEFCITGFISFLQKPGRTPHMTTWSWGLCSVLVFFLRERFYQHMAMEQTAASIRLRVLWSFWERCRTVAWSCTRGLWLLILILTINCQIKLPTAHKGIKSVLYQDWACYRVVQAEPTCSMPGMSLSCFSSQSIRNILGCCSPGWATRAGIVKLSQWSCNIFFQLICYYILLLLLPDDTLFSHPYLAEANCPKA